MMLDADLRLINEEFYADSIGPAELDELLADAWRHFGTQFFRYNLGFYESEIRRVIPLRIRLADFSLSKSQRRILRKNTDLQTTIRPVEITDETHLLFDRHKERFKSGTPGSVYDFVSHDPASVPCAGLEVGIYGNNKLLAASFFDIGETSISSIYAIFDPDETSRSLGILTMLREIEFAQASGREFYYHGYAYEGESYYDYKKRFLGLEQFDWKGNWERLSRREHREAETNP